MAQPKNVYTIKNQGEDHYWVKIGRAFVNKDGSLNVYLDALPLTGQLHIRDPKPKEGSAQVEEPATQG